MTYLPWEYLSVRFSFKSRSGHQEFSYITVDGETMRPDNYGNIVSTLPELLAAVGSDGWEMVTHTTTSAGHYMHFKRQGIPTTTTEPNQESKAKLESA